MASPTANPQSVLEWGVAEGVFPGAVGAVFTPESVEIYTAGNIAQPHSLKVDKTTLYDVASLTKVMVTTSIAMRLWEAGRLNFEDQVGLFLPAFAREDLIVDQLLLHTSGIAAFIPVEQLPEPGTDIVACIHRTRRTGRDRINYSCLNFVLLEHVLVAIGRKSLDALFRMHVAEPLGLHTAQFNPHENAPIAPTERKTEARIALERVLGDPNADDPYVIGQVHDELAYWRGGVSGNAGLFATIGDVVKWGQAVLKPSGWLKPETIRTFTHLAPRSIRSRGFDRGSADGTLAQCPNWADFYGHLGFTGTSVWINPRKNMGIALLSNRVYPTRSGPDILPIRQAFHAECCKYQSHS